MNYVDDIAAEIRRHLAPDALPDGDTETLLRLYALLALTKGPEVTREDVHDAWSVWMALKGETHESLVPFDRLSEDVRRLDETYVEAIRAVAARRRERPGL